MSRKRPYLTASNLQRKEYTLTMSHVTTEPIGKDRELRPVLHFQGNCKPLVLTQSNARIIASLYGDDPRQYAGKRITLFTVIRLRAPEN
jgi:hypothetical protein